MIEVSRFYPSDLDGVHVPDANDVNALAMYEAWTMRIHGRVVGCAGIIPIWPGRFQAWAYIAEDIGPAGMVALTRAVRRFLALQHGRIEAHVVTGFKQGERWAKLLGFKRETPKPMRSFMPDGSSANLFARVT